MWRHVPERFDGAGDVSVAEPCGKVRFRSERDALKELRRIRLTVRGKRSAHKIPTRAYLCTVEGCGAWHLTAQTFRH